VKPLTEWTTEQLRSALGNQPGWEPAAEALAELLRREIERERERCADVVTAIGDDISAIIGPAEMPYRKLVVRLQGVADAIRRLT